MNIKDSISKKFRKSFANRRRAARYRAQQKVRFLVNVSVVADEQITVPHPARTRDLSADGLAVIVPSLIIEGRYINSPDCTLRIVILELPTGHVELDAVPVRYEQLVGDSVETGHLIGLRISQMSDMDRARYIEFLRTLE